MSRFAKTLVFVTTLSTLTLVVFPVAAQLEPIKNANLGIQEKGDLRNVIVAIINVGLGLVALAAAIYIIISGVRYITSQGDEGTTEKAKRGIMYAVLGLIVIGLAALIVNFVIAAIGRG